MRSTCRSKGEKSCVWILFAACMVIAAVLAAPVAQAGATTITLVLSAGGVATSSVSSGTVVTLTATVTNPAAVTAGTVNFCNATATECLNQTLIGTAQLTAAGTAVIRLLPGIGSRSYKAVFVATTTNATSTSTAQPLTVTGLYPTSTTISSSGSPGNYTLTGTVVGTGSYSLSPTGSVSFLDTTNSNYLVGSASLGSSTITPSFPNVTYSAGGTPTGLAVADFNNDGIPDVAVPNCSGNSMSILLGTSTGTLGAPLTPANATGNCPLFTAVGDGVEYRTSRLPAARCRPDSGARPNMGGPALRHSSQTARAVSVPTAQFRARCRWGILRVPAIQGPPFDLFDAGSRSNHHGAWRMRCRRCK